MKENRRFPARHLPRPLSGWTRRLFSETSHDLVSIALARRVTALIAVVFGVPALLCLWLYVLFYKRDNLLLLYLPLVMATLLLGTLVQRLRSPESDLPSRFLPWGILLYTLACLVYRAAAPGHFGGHLDLLVALLMVLAGVTVCQRFPPVRAGLILALLLLLHSLPLLAGVAGRRLTGPDTLIGLVTEFMLTALLALIYGSAWTQLALGQSEATSLQLEHLSQTDHLTGLSNRRSLYRSIEALMAEVALGEIGPVHTVEPGAPPTGRIGTFSLALLDIDHFKNVNDTYGHATGDAVLCGVAEVLETFLRRRDLAGRWGGEEFVLVLPGVPLERAVGIADRLRQRIEGARMLPGRSVTASFGVTAWQPGDSLEALMARADAAMYRAKHGGRNRVEHSGAPETGQAEGRPPAEADLLGVEG